MGDYDNIKLPWSEWKVTKRLGEGGFGAVYEAERDLFGKAEKSAVKVLSIPSDPGEIESDYSDGYDHDSIIKKYRAYLQQIISEYQIMSELRGHPNIVNCHDVTTVAHKDGIGWDVYIRMELLTPLQKYLRNQSLTMDQIIKLGMDICRALVICENKSIVHRDIKPENILISEYGDYKLGDFGIARHMDHATGATKIGTERYIAPEVIMQDKYDRSVDIYSLGLVLHWLLNERRMPFISGMQPPSSSEVRTALKRRLLGEPIPEPVHGSQELKAAVCKACAYNPKDRFSSAQEMLNALQAVRDGGSSARASEPKSISGGKDVVHKIAVDSYIQPKPADEKNSLAHVKSKMLGIHIGVNEVCVSTFFLGQCRVVAQMPAYVAITPTGETLAGERAVRYKSCHANTPLFSAIDLLKADKYSSGFYNYYKGANMNDIFSAFAKEIRRKINETQWKDLKLCTLTVTNCSADIKDRLRFFMSQAGFEVFRILNTAVACSFFDLYSRTDETCHIGFVMEGNNAEISFIEYGDDIFEVTGLCSLSLDPTKQFRTSVFQELLMQKCPDKQADIKKTAWTWYGDKKVAATYTIKTILDVSSRASGGAALYGAQIYKEIPDRLCLLAIPNAYGLEVVGTDGKKEQKLLDFQWMLEDQTLIPVKSKEVIYEHKSGVQGEETLRIYGSVTNYGENSCQRGPVIARENLQKLLKAYFSGKPEKLGISLSLDPGEHLTVILRDLATGERHEVLFSEKYSIPEKKGVFPQNQILVYAWIEMVQLHKSVQAMTQVQKETPIGAGLLKIDKQCEQFLNKRGMSYAVTPREGEFSSTLDETRTGLADELLQILDSMEYGIRSISEGAMSQPERILIRCYWFFLYFLDQRMDIRPIPAEGEYFDANCHYALMHETNSKLGKNMVSEEMQRGYYMGKQVLRPSKVKVVN